MDGKTPMESPPEPPYKYHRYSGGKPLPTGSTIVHHVGATPPPGAVYMSKADVLQIQRDIIAKYKPRRDMWPFTFGVGIAGGLAAITGGVCNSLFRQRMRLYKYKGITTLVSSCAIPCLCSMMFQAACVMEPILLREYDCPLCITTRASCGQMFFAGFQAPVMSFLSCASVATFGFRYKMPPLSEPVAWFKKAHSLTKPHYSKLLLLILLNGWYAGILAKRQQSKTYLVHSIMRGEDAVQRESDKAESSEE